jgi:hypothetical protein
MNTKNATTKPEPENQQERCGASISGDLFGVWSPIETAPKDGTSILLAWAINADGEPIRWEEDPKTAQVHVQVAAWWEGEDAWIVYCAMVRDPKLHFIPTHWMPLPPSPNDQV